jgi:hypothetical protein
VNKQRVSDAVFEGYRQQLRDRLQLEVQKKTSVQPKDSRGKHNNIDVGKKAR